MLATALMIVATGMENGTNRSAIGHNAEHVGRAVKAMAMAMAMAYGGITPRHGNGSANPTHSFERTNRSRPWSLFVCMEF